MSLLTLRALRPEDLDRVSEIERLIAGQTRRGILERRFAAAAADPDSFITSAAVCDDVLTGYGFVRLRRASSASAARSRSWMSSASTPERREGARTRQCSLASKNG